MRVVVQRVQEASVKVEGQLKGRIDKGLLVLVGIIEADTIIDVEWLTKKIIHQRIFSDKEGKMNLSLEDVKGDILLISQFTLYAHTKKGNRPSYTRSAKPDVAIPLYEQMIESLSNTIGKRIQTGVFGADMKVSLINDGPVTIIMDSKDKEL